MNGGLIAEDVASIAGLNSYEWDLTGFAENDSIRIRIVSNEKVVLDEETEQYVKARDINGWYIKTKNPSTLQSVSSNSRYFIGPRNTQRIESRK